METKAYGGSYPDQRQMYFNTFAMKQLRDRVLHHLAATTKVYKDPQGVAAWEEQFTTVRERYKFLVLNGGAATGKTEWALAYFAKRARTPEEYIIERDKMLLLLCSGDTMPNLGKYRYGEHLGIVFDEGSPEMVWANRVVFLGLPELCTIGYSQTNLSCQEVCLSGCRIIITSSDWWERMQYLTEPQQRWFEANSIVIDVVDPLYTDISLYNPSSW